MAIYTIKNGPAPTTAAFAKVATGTAIKTMLQFQLAAGFSGHLIEWGISFDGSTAATPIQVEVIETTTVAATVTASAAGDIDLTDGEALAVNAPGTVWTLGTSATGYTASAEGTVVGTTRMLAAPQLIAPTTQFIQQVPLSQESIIQPAKINRIRVTAGGSVGCYCYVKVQV